MEEEEPTRNVFVMSEAMGTELKSRFLPYRRTLFDVCQAGIFCSVIYRLQPRATTHGCESTLLVLERFE